MLISRKVLGVKGMRGVSRGIKKVVCLRIRGSAAHTSFKVARTPADQSNWGARMTPAMEQSRMETGLRIMVSGVILEMDFGRG